MPDLRRMPSARAFGKREINRVGQGDWNEEVLLAVASVVLGAASVHAADLAAHYTKAPVMAPAYNWTGFYVGANVGGQWGSSNPNTSTVYDPFGYFLPPACRPSMRWAPSTSAAPA